PPPGFPPLLPSDRVRRMEIHSLGVVGGGQMGNGIAHVAAAAGCSVVLVDVDDALLQKARGTIQKNLEREVAKGKRTAEERDAALGRIALTTRIEELASADAVIQAIVDNQPLNKELF